MIERYRIEPMKSIWTELNKKKQWFKVVQADLLAKENLGLAPQGLYVLTKQVEITEELLKRADEIEKVTDHDAVAWLRAVIELLDKIDPRIAVYFYQGLTSFAMEDTALMLMLLESLDLIQVKLGYLRQVLLKKAIDHRYTLQVARTHLAHAKPITFGLSILEWVDVIDRHIKWLDFAREDLKVGKFSGAVGTYAIDPRIEEKACEHLGLRPAKISTQILSRDRLVHLAMVLIGISNSLDRFAENIRILSGTDICEVAEFKKPGAKGSSAMPGKSRLGNPIKSENVCSLAKVARGFYVPALECEPVLLQRTLDNSAAERIYLPDLIETVDFMLWRFADTMEKLEVFPEQMKRNIWRTGGIIFAEDLMVAMSLRGMPRNDAYDHLEALTLKVEKGGSFRTKDGLTFKDLVSKDPLVNQLLSPEEIDQCFDPEKVFESVDYTFARFGL